MHHIFGKYLWQYPSSAFRRRGSSYYRLALLAIDQHTTQSFKFGMLVHHLVCIILKHYCKFVSLTLVLYICSQEVGPRVVPHLPKFMPLFVGILSETVNSAEPSALLLAGVIGAIDTTVDMLPHFLSPYLSGLLDGLLSPSVQNVVDDASNGEFSAIKSKAREVLRNMAQKIPPRVFLAPVFKRYSTAVQNGKEVTYLFLRFYC